jgi:hypothetical protein
VPSCSDPVDSDITLHRLRARLEHEDGTPADPPTLHTAVPNWQVGDTIPLGADRMFRVIEVRPESNADDNPVLVVEHV